ncbi:MAG: hypothetical protein J5771_06955 [Bacteroidales bacterium]|nr:hypothetical protein [Bacteroidales bacterium]
MRRSVFLVLLPLCVMLASCQKDSPAKKKDSPGKKSTAVLPSAGGEAVLGEVTLSAAAGAVTEDQEVTLTYYVDPNAISDNSFRDAEGAYMMLPGEAISRMDFGPEGLVFESPVTVEVPCPGVPADKVDVLWLNKTTGEWVSMAPITVQNGKASFQVNHFSTYVAVNIGMAAMSKVETYVMNGLRSGSSADEIAAAFHEYAVNGEGRNLMRRPMKDIFTGLYYEPFYSFCSVDWCVRADGIDSEALPAGLSQMGSKPENVSFRGSFKNAAYHSGYDSESAYRQGVSDWKQTDKSFKLFSAGVEILYKLAKPRLQLSPDKQLKKKGDAATVTLTVDLFDEVQGDYIPVDYVDIQLSSSDPSVVSISKQEVDTDGSGKATFKVKVLKSIGTSTITAKYHKTGPLWVGIDDDVTEETSFTVTLGDAWELSFHVDASSSAKYSVKDPLLLDDYQCNNPENSFRISFDGSATFNVSRESGKAKDVYEQVFGEPVSAEALAEMGFGLNDEVEYDRINGVYNLEVDPTKDAHYNLPDFIASGHMHQDLGTLSGEPLYADTYFNTNCSYSVSFPNRNNKQNIPFTFMATDATKGFSITLCDLSALMSQMLSNPNIYYEESLLVTKVTKSGSTSTRIVSNITGTEEGSEEIKGDSDYILLPMTLVTCLQEGTHQLSFDYASLDPTAGGNHMLMLEWEAPIKIAPEMSWIDNWDETKDISGTITLKKIQPEQGN